MVIASGSVAGAPCFLNTPAGLTRRLATADPARVVRDDSLQPGRLAPLFVLTALIHGAAVISRFDLVYAEIPELVHAAVLCAQLPLLLVTGYYESRLDHGPSMPGLPVWMQIQSRPVKWSLTLGFTYLAIVALQTLEVSLGPIDPTPPLEFPPAQRLLWFLGFSFGMFFANYMLTAATLVPALRLLCKPLRRLPAPVALVILALLGLLLGLAALAAIDQRQGPQVAQLQGYYAALQREPGTALALAAAGVLGPSALAALAGRLRPAPRVAVKTAVQS